MYHYLKLIVLYLSKFIGLFRLSRRFTRHQLRILAYHNFSVGDELSWRPKLYQHPEIFEKRLSFLKNYHYPILSLDHALSGLASGTLPDGATVITFDDGWYNVYKYCCPMLVTFDFPYTIYLASYYSMKDTPVFNLIVQYLFWKTGKDVSQIDFSRALDLDIDLKDSKDICLSIIEYGEGKLEYRQRNELISRLCDVLNIDYEKLLADKTFTLINEDQLRELSGRGADLQLHTHRHRWPMDKENAVREIFDNRTYLEPIAGQPLIHFCYPSGFWKDQQLDYLKESNVKSAVTCDPGFNLSTTDPLTLKRFLDGQYISQIAFEAEMSGFLEVFRRFRDKFL